MSYPRRSYGERVVGSSRRGCTTRLVIALIFIAFGVIKFYSTTEVVQNAYTGENQRVGLSLKQEVMLGLQSRDQMIRMHGGEDPDPRKQAIVDAVGEKLVANTNKMAKHGEPVSYPFDFHLLADEKRINAFALPGGQIFITDALFDQLKTEDQLAAVLGHEIGHVLCKHSNQQIAKSGLIQSIGTGVGVAVGGENMNNSQQIANLVNTVVATKYGREDEYESDEIGAWLMKYAGYNPAEMLGVLEILRRAAGGANPPEMLSTHPHPENRIERMKMVLQQLAGSGA